MFVHQVFTEITGKLLQSTLSLSHYRRRGDSTARVSSQATTIGGTLALGWLRQRQYHRTTA